MDRRSSDQLEKVLALADSAHDFEAAVAVRKARQMLARNGLAFGDLARAASRSGFSFFSNNSRLESHAVRLRQQLQDMQADLLAQAAQTEFWRSRAAELERGLSASRDDVARWQRLARDVAEKLWDLGQSIGAAPDPAGEEPLPQRTASGRNSR